MFEPLKFECSELTVEICNKRFLKEVKHTTQSSLIRQLSGKKMYSSFILLERYFAAVNFYYTYWTLPNADDTLN